jgi:drug/metabolite transporter (DMT)-like permease
MIPFTSWLLLKQRPTQRNIIAAIICLVGVGFISMSSGLGDFTLSFGDVLTLLCAVAFSFNLVFLGKWAKTIDPIALTFAMFLLAGIVFAVGAAFTEPAPNASWLQPNVVACLAYLFLLASMTAQVMQNIGLKVVRPSQASIIMCTEGGWAVLFSVIFYGERLTATTVVGFVLVFVAMIYSQLRLKRDVTVKPSASI